MSRYFFVFLMITGCIQAQEIRINQLQVIGSHNSYKKAMDPAIMAMLTARDSTGGRSLDYSHIPLSAQLDMGLRTLEIDVFYDPEGGRYAYPNGIKRQQAMGLTVEVLDTTIMSQAGFKVLHIQDIDFRSHCNLLSDCLGEIREWSEKHPTHIPIMISFNAKEGAIESQPEFAVPLKFTKEAFDALDREITSTIPSANIITPDQIRSDHSTLEESVLSKGWPRLDEARGKFIFVLDAGAEQQAVYTADHPNLQGRVMFTIAPMGSPESAILFMNDPIKQSQEILAAVKLGYLVRTRADAGTKEARTGNYDRFEMAKSTGAHYISTDYYKVDPRFGTDFKISFEDNFFVRCNPITGYSNCNKNGLE